MDCGIIFKAARFNAYINFSNYKSRACYSITNLIGTNKTCTGIASNWLFKVNYSLVRLYGKLNQIFSAIHLNYGIDIGSVLWIKSLIGEARKRLTVVRVSRSRKPFGFIGKEYYFTPVCCRLDLRLHLDFNFSGLRTNSQKDRFSIADSSANRDPYHP